jgi:cyclase
MNTDAETPKLITLGDRFRVRQEIDNIGWADLGGYAIVVDALEKPETGEAVFAALDESLGDTPVRYLLNTHTHYDHVALNDDFRRRGAEVINLQTVDLPDDGRWFEGDARRALMLPLPGCHTATDCVVWVEPERVLFAGDLFGWGLIPLTRPLRKDTYDMLRRIYARMIDFGAETVVPGHGPLATTETLRRQLQYYEWLIEQAGKALADGRSRQQFLEATPPPEDMADWWRFAEWKHADSAAKVYGAVERGRLEAG